jgi:hypothetical protein
MQLLVYDTTLESHPSISPGGLYGGSAAAVLAQLSCNPVLNLN